MKIIENTILETGELQLEIDLTEEEDLALAKLAKEKGMSKEEVVISILQELADNCASEDDAPD